MKASMINRESSEEIKELNKLLTQYHATMFPATIKERDTFLKKAKETVKQLDDFEQIQIKLKGPKTRNTENFDVKLQSNLKGIL
tara:strand:- start:1328 stop:1579 length:252 start_codon:yes stop_codon:yes gene_type:complete